MQELLKRTIYVFLLFWGLCRSYVGKVKTTLSQSLARTRFSFAFTPFLPLSCTLTVSRSHTHTHTHKTTTTTTKQYQPFLFRQDKGYGASLVLSPDAWTILCLSCRHYLVNICRLYTKIFPCARMCSCARALAPLPLF